MNAQTIVTNRNQHKKGGIGNYAKFKNEVNRTFAQGNVIITTLIDFFGIPTDFPDYTTDSQNIEQIEAGIFRDFNNNPDFIPYIQRHEVEALMFSDISGFNLVIDDSDKLKKIESIFKKYPNPEDINNSPETTPSKRLSKIFRYDKISDGEMIFEMIGIQPIINKCPRFADWINKIATKLSN